MGNYAGAITYIDKGLENNPNDINTLNKKGYAFILQGKDAESLDLFDKVLGIDPNNLAALKN
jgi:tetratricopeptide (TPR) repeat protein